MCTAPFIGLRARPRSFGPAVAAPATDACIQNRLRQSLRQAAKKLESSVYSRVWLAVEAIEVIKLILGKGQTLTGKMLTLDTMSLEFKKLRMRRDPECPVCSDNPTITELIDYEQFCSFEP